ncbi:Panacea domain-containing protein [Weeksellaceae bacterium A-14]
MSLELNIQSFIQPVLYILNKAGKPLDTHKISKILYFADREHLAKYGTTITDDNYIAMKYGPVPSNIYDIIKVVLGKGEIIPEEITNKYFEKSSPKEIGAVIGFDEDEFSKSELECLNNSLKKYLHKSFQFLTDESHDLAWNEALYDMDILKIAKAGGADRSMLNYIKEHNELANARFY